MYVNAGGPFVQGQISHPRAYTEEVRVQTGKTRVGQKHCQQLHIPDRGYKRYGTTGATAREGWGPRAVLNHLIAIKVDPPAYDRHAGRIVKIRRDRSKVACHRTLYAYLGGPRNRVSCERDGAQSLGASCVGRRRSADGPPIGILSLGPSHRHLYGAAVLHDKFRPLEQPWGSLDDLHRCCGHGASTTAEYRGRQAEELQWALQHDDVIRCPGIAIVMRLAAVFWDPLSNHGPGRVTCMLDATSGRLSKRGLISWLLQFRNAELFQSLAQEKRSENRSTATRKGPAKSGKAHFGADCRLQRQRTCLMLKASAP